MMKKILILLGIVAVVALSSCERRCHCYGYDGSHTYFTKRDLAEMDVSCVGMQEWQLGLMYSLCEYDFSSYD